MRHLRRQCRYDLTYKVSMPSEHRKQDTALLLDRPRTGCSLKIGHGIWRRNLPLDGTLGLQHHRTKSYLCSRAGELPRNRQGQLGVHRLFYSDRRKCNPTLPQGEDLEMIVPDRRISSWQHSEQSSGTKSPTLRMNTISDASTTETAKMTYRMPHWTDTDS
jgi:hypothetical protein